MTLIWTNMLSGETEPVKVRKKSGEERTFVAKPEPPFRNDEIMAKFKKSAEFFKQFQQT